MYTNLGTSGSGHVGPIPIESEVDFKLLIVTGLAGYRVVDQGPLFVDLMAGARLTGAKAKLEISGPFETRERTLKKTQIGPVLASRLGAPLGGKWGASVYGDVGGFGISSDLSWQLMGTIQYQLSKKWQLGAGWRHLSARVERRGFKFKQVLDGPILVVRFRF
jgi:hypothetical protein